MSKLPKSENADFMKVRITGSMDAEQYDKLKAEFEHLLQNFKRDIALDLSEVDFIDSVGTAAMLELYHELHCRELEMVIIGAGGQVASFLNYLQLGAVIPLLPLEAEQGGTTLH